MADGGLAPHIAESWYCREVLDFLGRDVYLPLRMNYMNAKHIYPQNNSALKSVQTHFGWMFYDIYDGTVNEFSSNEEDISDSIPSSWTK